MDGIPVFRSYRSADCQACIDVFDANCPEFFAPNERTAYRKFLETVPGGYEVCVVDGRVRGAFGLLGGAGEQKRLSWILLDPRVQGAGIGSRIMKRVVHLGRASQTRIVNIAASQKSAAFFARFGATAASTTTDGWGPGMDRIDMVLRL